MIRSRRLVAIMFTDIAGYTTLMSEDEEKALGILRRSRSIQQKEIQSYNGTWLKAGMKRWSGSLKKNSNQMDTKQP